ncbi:general substrate transporter [Calocera viscosa TUFC12733]|uniref:General substrate transporter n=1 Tax=Calocera viscosa (strain TUFC12733) TaxID=1330018 RepID=A0A167GZV2_CALVF|nr:general substrate transporter [Calocera viscosa TUFC12733]
MSAYSKEKRSYSSGPQKTFLGQTKAAWYIYWICGVASIANIFQGFDGGIYSIILSDPRFIDYFNVAGARLGVVSSMINLGNVIGNLFVAWWFIWYTGRRMAFALGTIILLVGVALQAGAVAFAMIVVGRIISGIGTAIIGTNLAAYQAEVSPPSIRGRVVSFVQLSYQIGVLISYCVGLGTVNIAGENSWRTATALQCVPGVILILASFTIPESPRWLLERHPGKPERALRQLSRLRLLPENHPEVQTEFVDMVAARQYRVEHQGDLSWWTFLSQYAVWKRLAYGMATMALGQISGVGALMIYGVLIFQSLGFSSGTMSLLLNVVSGVLCLLATLITTGGVDKWGRRITLLAGSSLMVLSYIIISALSDAFPADSNPNRAASIVQVIFIFIIEMAYSGALGPTAWIYASEIFPTHLRDKGVNISQAAQQTTTLWINQAWPVMFDTVGHNAYWILVGINTLGFLMVLFFWPETKGISLEHMDKIFGEVDQVEAYRGEHHLENREAVHAILEKATGHHLEDVSSRSEPAEDI